jgi:acyl carrier protein
MKERTMPTESFSIDDLMTLLVTKAGLPPQARTDNPQWTFADIGLDSLAFLQLQAELQSLYRVELPTERPQAYTFGQIVNHVNESLALNKERVS